LRRGPPRLRLHGSDQASLVGDDPGSGRVYSVPP
jgi:hypothetical protein